METYEYKTRTFFKEIHNPVLSPDKWCIGLDIGYGGVKGYAQNTAFCFPAFAIENPGSTRIDFGFDQEQGSLIQYKDDAGRLWNVGECAQDIISASDTSAGSLAAYGRHRYTAPMFTVLFRVGMAASMRKNQFGDPADKELVIQSGLPPKYLNADKDDFKEVMLGTHHYFVKFGAGPWEEFNFAIYERNILPLISQPMGTLLSIATTVHLTPTPDAPKYLGSKILIMDVGFGTLDLFPMTKGDVTIAACETDEHLGMKQILQDTAADILQQFHFEVSVPAMQQYLSSGVIPAKVGKAYKKMSFKEILNQHSRDICNKAIDKVLDTYNIAEYQYLVITGGTGAAWSTMIRENEVFKESDTIQIVSGNQGDPSLPYVLSNARGYYIYAVINANASAS